MNEKVIAYLKTRPLGATAAGVARGVSTPIHLAYRDLNELVQAKLVLWTGDLYSLTPAGEAYTPPALPSDDRADVRTPETTLAPDAAPVRAEEGRGEGGARAGGAQGVGPRGVRGR